MKKKRNSVYKGHKRLLSFLLMICLSLPTFAGMQGGKVSLRMESVSVQEVIEEIGNQIGIGFLYRGEELKNHMLDKVNYQGDDWQEVITEILEPLGKTFKVEKDLILIVDKPEEIQESIKEEQEKKSIKGKVSDKDSAPLPGVSVVIKGTSTGTATDLDGNYTLEVEREGVTLLFSFIGMTSQEITYRGQKVINVALEPDTKQMDEVVVTGIFKKKKSSYVGSVTTVDNKELKMFGNRNVLSTLKNIDPSFNIVDNNVFGSDPNRLPEINMRGNSSLPSVSELQSDTRANLNTPLIILDGFEISLQKMVDLNDDEVNSITLLKDASATAIYGSRGANGVVVITTKEPEEGRMKFTVKSTINVEMADLSSYDLLNAEEKLDLEYQAGLYDDFDGFLSDDVILKELYNKNLKSVRKGNDTDWLAKPLRTGVGQRHNLKIEGGNSSMRYAASVDYNHIAGVMKGSNRSNLNGTVTLSYKYKNLIFRNQLGVGVNKSEQSPYGSFNSYVRLNPYWTPYDEDGNIAKFFDRTEEYWGLNNYPANPLYNAKLNSKDENEYTDISNNFSLEWKMNKDFTLRGQIGFLKQANQSDQFTPPTNTKYDSYTGEDLFRKGEYIFGTGKVFNIDSRLTLNYSKVVAEKHQFYLGLDYSMSENKSEGYTYLTEGFSSDEAFVPLALGYEKGGKPSGFENTTRRVGFTSNLNYIYDNRFFVDASYRIDGSSQFGSKKRFAPFWSTGIGWNIHEESFLKDSDLVSRLRLKASYGTTGSQNFPAYQAARTYQYSYGDRYLSWSGANLLGLGNKNLEWQSTKQYNVGVESSFFNTKLKLSADVYYKTTSNLLSQMNLDLSNGFSSYTENVGEVENKGFELMASAFIFRNTEKELIWSVTGRLTHNKNEITKLSEAIKEQNELAIQSGGATRPNTLMFEGKPIDAIYVVRSLGIDPSTGKELFLKRNGEVTTTWDPEDRVYAGVTNPKYRGNISSMFRYKNLTANVSFAYQWGGQKYNSTLISRVENADFRYNVDERVYKDRWQKPGDITFFKDRNDDDVTFASSRFVQDETSLICQNVNISYDMRNSWIRNNLKMQSLRFSFNTDNLFHISSIKAERGLYYPFSRRFSLSIAAVL